MTGPEVFEVWWKTNEVTLRLEHGQSLGRIVKAAFLAGAQAERARCIERVRRFQDIVGWQSGENRNLLIQQIEDALRQEAPDATT